MWAILSRKRIFFSFHFVVANPTQDVCSCEIITRKEIGANEKRRRRRKMLLKRCLTWFESGCGSTMCPKVAWNEAEIHFASIFGLKNGFYTILKNFCKKFSRIRRQRQTRGKFESKSRAKYGENSFCIDVLTVKSFLHNFEEFFLKEFSLIIR